MGSQSQIVRTNLAEFYRKPTLYNEENLINSIKRLGDCKHERVDALTCLLSMILERPWGDNLDPKEWRRCIKESITKLLRLDELYQQLLLEKDIAKEELNQLWEAIFEPLEILSPLLNSKEHIVAFYDSTANEINMCIGVLEKVLIDKDLDEGMTLWCDFDDFLVRKYTEQEIASYSNNYPALLRNIAGSVFS